MSTLVLAVAVRPVLLGLQLDLRPYRPAQDLVARRGRLGALLGHPGERLGRRPVLHDHVPGGAEVGARAALRGGLDRRRHLVAAHLVRDPADDAQHHRHHHPVLD